MAASKPYDLTDLMRFTPDDFGFLSTRPADGMVVVFDKRTREDVSIPLTEFEADALGHRLASRWPEENCGRHRPYQRGGRNSWSGDAACRCALPFRSSLMVSWLRLRVSQMELASR